MNQTYDVNIEEFKQIISPSSIKEEIPIADDIIKTIFAARNDLENILTKKDNRLLVISGPCSIHDTDAAIEYAQKLMELRKEVKEKINLIMRVYFEKPRTRVGWTGLINDPFLIQPMTWMKD